MDKNKADVNKTMGWFFKSINKINESLVRLSKFNGKAQIINN